MLAVVKPSPLRLWGFLLTVVGGALMAFGSIGDWAAVSLGGSTENAVPTKGIDLWQGKVTVLIGALIIVGILALRFVRPERRNLLAGGIVVLGAVGFGIALWCVIALDSVVRDSGIDALIDLVVTQLGLTPAEARTPGARRARHQRRRGAGAALALADAGRIGARGRGRVRGPGVGATQAGRRRRDRSRHAHRERREARATPRRTAAPDV